MIVETREACLDRSGVRKRTACGILNSAKAFELLARQYSNPIKAIVQELSANAFDAQKRIGKEARPFTVKLPNRMEPHFRIRDYGVSMSPELINDVYTTYMKSDKTSSNDETGCFGIGSKTPFAYTDSFNIVTYLDGVKRLYVLAYNEQGIPELNEFDPMETTEENGVEISFSVRVDDFDKFANEATRVLKFFKTEPEVTGNPSYQRYEFKKVLEGETWYFTKENTSYAVMGNIAYPIDSYQFGYGHERDILKDGVIVEIPLGEMNMTPSREALEYTSKTIQTIKNALEKVSNEAHAVVEREIADAKSLWSASLKAKTFSQRFNFLDVSKITWQGKALYESFSMPVSKGFYLNYNDRIKTDNYGGSNNILCSEDVKVVIKDESKLHIAKIKYFIKENQNEKVKVFLIDPDAILNATGVMVDYKHIVKDIKKVAGITDADNVFMYVSEMARPPKAVRTSNGKRSKDAPIAVREYCPDRNGDYIRRRSYDSQYWKLVENFDVINAPEFVYVLFDNYSTSCNGEGVNVKELIAGLKQVGVTVPTVYGVTKNYMKKVERNAKALDFMSWFKTVITKKVQDKIIDNLNKVEFEEFDRVKNFIPYFSGIKKSSLFNQFLDLATKHKEREKYNSEFLREVSKVSGIDFTNRQDNVPSVKLMEQVRNQYALAIYLIMDSHYFNTDKVKEYANHIVNTVNALDKV